MNGDDWFDMSEERRREEYDLRRQALDMIVRDVREHRAEACEGAPMCPGAAAGRKVNSVPPQRIGELLMTCLAGLADRDERIEAIEAAHQRTIDRSTGEIARLERELAAARRDADTGWNAYRNATAALANTGKEV